MRVKLIKAQVFLQLDQRHESDRQAKCKSEYIDERKQLVPGKIPPGQFAVMKKHKRLIEKIAPRGMPEDKQLTCSGLLMSCAEGLYESGR